MFTIDFPVKPHVKKYLNFKFGNEYTVSKTDFLGDAILDMLSNRYSSTLVNKGLTESYKIFITQKYINERGFHFTPGLYNQFNKRIDSLFFEDLYSMYLMNVKETKIMVVTRFLDRLDICESEYSTDSIIKRLNRRIKKDKEKAKKTA